MKQYKRDQDGEVGTVHPHQATVVLFRHIGHPSDIASESLRPMALKQCAPYPEEVEKCLKELSAPYSEQIPLNAPYFVVVYGHSGRPVYWDHTMRFGPDSELSLYWWFVDALGGGSLLLDFVPDLDAVQEELVTLAGSGEVGK